MLVLVVYTLISALIHKKQADLSELGARLMYIVSLRIARATQRSLVPKPKNQNAKTENKIKTKTNSNNDTNALFSHPEPTKNLIR